MKEISSALGSEILRPLVTIVTPGAIGAAPWLFWMFWSSDSTWRFAKEYRSESVTLVLLAVVFAGMVFEELGSHAEWVLDKLRDRRTKGAHTEEWNAYLLLAFSPEPVGHRYLRTLVMRLKFELGCGVGLFVAWLGIHMLPTDWGVRSVLLWAVLPLAFGALIEARWTHDLLGDVRKRLLAAYGTRSIPLSNVAATA